MTQYSYLFAFCASFVFVALKAMQQLNVANFHWKSVIPVSVGMTACEFYLVVYMVSIGPSLPGILTIGTGAGLGAITSMYIYKRWR